MSGQLHAPADLPQNKKSMVIKFETNSPEPPNLGQDILRMCSWLILPN
jgi:hypothetical protein